MTLPMSILFMFHGVSAAMAGKWQMKVGPKVAIASGAVAFGGGLCAAAAGIAIHSLPLVYFGYGVMGGIGVGLSYTPPVQTLVEWFPDRKGLASGLAIGGFGSGALLFAPAVTALKHHFSSMPTYLGTDIETVNKAGSMFSQVEGELREVVLATSSDLVKLPYDLAEGYYLVGSGNTGAAAALACCGFATFSAMSLSALALRHPGPGYLPPLSTDSSQSTTTPLAHNNVHCDTVMKVPQFYMLALMFFAMSGGGMAVISVAKPMMSEVFQRLLPEVATPAFASSFVLALAAGNLGGRLGWSAISDRIGRRTTFQVFTLTSAAMYLATPALIDLVVATGSVAPLYAYVGATVTAISIMGGCYAVLPAYESDLFGTKYLGANHGRMLLASTCAALAGPSLLLKLRHMSENQAINDLLSKVDPDQFQRVFKSPISNAPELLESKALTLGKLVDLAPEGMLDPSPFIYNSTMYAMAGLMSIAAVASFNIKPVHPRYYENNTKIQ